MVGYDKNTKALFKSAVYQNKLKINHITIKV